MRFWIAMPSPETSFTIKKIPWRKSLPFRQVVPIVSAVFIIFSGVLAIFFFYSHNIALQEAKQRVNQLAASAVACEELYRKRLEALGHSVENLLFSNSAHAPSLPVPDNLNVLIPSQFFSESCAVTIRFYDNQGRYISHNIGTIKQEDTARKAAQSYCCPGCRATENEGAKGMEKLLALLEWKAGWHFTLEKKIPERLVSYSISLNYPDYYSLRKIPGQENGGPLPFIPPVISPLIPYDKPMPFGVITITTEISWLEARIREVLPLGDSLFFLLATDRSWAFPAANIGDYTQKELSQIEKLKKHMESGATDAFRIVLQNKAYQALYVPFFSENVGMGLVVPEEELFWGGEKTIWQITGMLFAFLLLVLLALRRSVLHMSTLLESLGGLAGKLATGRVEYPFQPEVAPKVPEGEAARLMCVSEKLRGTLRERMGNLAVLALARQRYSTELRLGRRIQDGLLPRDLPEDSRTSIAAKRIMAWNMSGDIYDYFQIDENRMGLVLCQVQLSGLPATLLMCRVMPLVRELMLSGDDGPAETLRHTNAILASQAAHVAHLKSRDISRKLPLVNLFVGVLNLKSGLFTWAGAGQNILFIIKNNQRGLAPLLSCAWRLPGVYSSPLGISRSLNASENEMMLSPGDSLFLCNDNLLKVADTRGESFGENRLHVYISTHGAEPASMLAGLEKLLESYSEDNINISLAMLALRWHGHSTPDMPLEASGKDLT